MNALFGYFDLLSDTRDKAKALAGDKPPSVLLQYLFFVMGILVEPFLGAYLATGVWDLSGALGRALFAVIVGFAALPAVYKNSFDPTKPRLVQYAAIFSMGLGWQSIVQLANSAI